MIKSDNVEGRGNFPHTKTQKIKFIKGKRQRCRGESKKNTACTVFHVDTQKKADRHLMMVIVVLQTRDILTFVFKLLSVSIN